MRAKIALGIVVLAALFALVWWGAATPHVEVTPPPPVVSAEPTPTPTPTEAPVPPVAGNEGRVVIDAGVAPTPAASLPPPPPIDAKSALQGIETRELTAQDRIDLKLPDRLWGGVVITRIDPKSPAAEAHLAPNDVVFRAQGAKIQSIEDLQRAVGERGQSRIQVYRKGAPFEVVLQRPFTEQ